MRAVVLGLFAVGLLGTSGVARAADDYKKLIVGTWEIAYSDEKAIPVGTKLEFTADGKVKLTFKRDRQDLAFDYVYKIEKDVFVLAGPDPARNDKARICLLNNNSFVINDELEDKLIVLKRVQKK